MILNCPSTVYKGLTSNDLMHGVCFCVSMTYLYLFLYTFSRSFVTGLYDKYCTTHAHTHTHTHKHMQQIKIKGYFQYAGGFEPRKAYDISATLPDNGYRDPMFIVEAVKEK